MNDSRVLPAAYDSLRRRLDLAHALPYSENWSAGADYLGLIVDHCLSAQPSVILECGSGLTTVLLARSCQINGVGHVYSLENGQEYVRATTESLRAHDLERHASVIHAPLAERVLEGRRYQWYGTDGVPQVLMDMLVIDGPPALVRRHARYPALPVLFDKLAAGCAVYLDDASRDGEREIVALWRARYPSLTHEYVNTERGCSILRLASTG